MPASDPQDTAGSGHVAEFAGLVGVAANFFGIWSEGGGAIHKVMRIGDQAPGLAASVTYNNALGAFAMNSSDQMVFGSFLKGPGITSANDLAIFAKSAPGTVDLVVREGDRVEIRPGVFRTIGVPSPSSNALEIHLSPATGGEARLPRSLNDDGEIGFIASFLEGGRAVLVCNVDGCPVVHLGPDAKIDGLGNDIYNLTAVGQRIVKEVTPGERTKFKIAIQNDGPKADDFTISGPGNKGSLKAQYLDAAGVDVTAEVTAGSYVVQDLAPGASAKIRLRVKAGTNTLPGTSKTWRVTATSANDPLAKDAVQARVRVVAP